ncbi:MAG TPA: hypothetical protein VFZ59_21705 [Verrucomicrobiae bacterium]|nr:hypothetical protein [Verrucomicrobiae bacterium]
MIDRLLEIHLEPIARNERRARLLRTLTVGWLVAAGLALLLILIHRSSGWVSAWAFLLLVAATLVWTFIAWRRSNRTPLNFQSIARNIEAENPKLHTLLLTAVEQKPDSETHELNYLQDRVIREALAEDRGSLWRKRAARQLQFAQLGSIGALALFAVLSLTLYQAAPPRVAILKLTGRAVSVTPGDTSIEKGSSLVVLARFEGDVPSEASLILRPANQPEQRIPLTKNLDDPVFGTSLPEVQAELTYRVEYGNEQTREFRVTTFEFPRLERADAKVTYPDYTGLPEKTIEDTRRISAVEGSALDYTFHLNKPVKSATLMPIPERRSPDRRGPATNRLRADQEIGAPIPVLADPSRPNVYVSNFKLEKSGRYELILVDDAGRTNKVPPLFVLDALTNRAPDLKFAFPKGDQRVSALEEIAFKAEASDDFGLKGYGFAYNLAGEETKFVELGKDAKPHEKRALDHLVPLEDLGAQPDQLLSYYLWAEDIGPDGQPRRVTSDMFFAEVRPFEEIFREGQGQDPSQQQQQQQGQQGQNQAERLAELQKQIITATWNIQRRETGTSPTENFKKDAETVKESQENALEQVRSRMEEGDDPRAKALLATVEKEMAKAVEHLAVAVDDTSPKALPPALSSEQSAYQALLRLAAREIQVSQGRPGQQSQSSRGQRAQRQLNQLDLRQAQNRYETERQAAMPQNQQQREQMQAFNRLKELAQRQQDVNERLKELQAALQAAQTEAEREELRQRLKRLQEEQQQMLADVDELQQRMERPENQSQMAEARQQLEQTRNEVQQASEAMQRGDVSQALSSGTRAQRELQEMRDDFRKQNSSQFAEDMRELRSQARELAEKQDEIGQKLDAMDAPDKPKSLTDSDERKELASQLDEQKKRMDELVKHATDVTQKAEPVEPLLSRQLYDTLRKATQDDAKNLQDTSDDLLTQGRLRQSVYDRLRESRRSGQQAVEVTADLLREGFSAEASNLEQRARRSINDFKSGVERAAESVLGDDTEALRMARDELEQLSRQIERELAQAQRGSNTNRSGSQPGEMAENGQQQRGGNQNRQPGESREGEQANAQGEREGQQPGGQQQAQNQSQQGQGQQGESQQNGGRQPGDQPGQQQAQSGQQGQGQNGQPQDGSQQGGQGQGQGGQQQLANANQQRGGNNPGQAQDGQPGQRDGNRQNGGQRGGGTFLDQLGGDDNGGSFAGGPITGAEYTQWTDRLRDVEEMLDVPELRAEAARIRDRARNVRQDLKRHSREPQWDLVKMQIAGPLIELRSRVAEELARRESKEALVPIDRDPVPTRYSELVRRYYEELGRSEGGKATDAGGVK